ncbi:MAG: AbrB/MazE/SpoVT family DNA-binding domain-containing protein [archaeon YNP-LCB-024-027]|nr:AbrB/MazE/SpoVT family DNA-binding domain-containing protein [Candidatus Culexarchaeum yellowstonense]
MKIRVGKRGTIVIPKSIREKLGIEEGAVLELEVVEGGLLLKVVDLWQELRKRGRNVEFDVNAFERELDEAEENWLKRRKIQN